MLNINKFLPSKTEIDKKIQELNKEVIDYFKIQKTNSDEGHCVSLESNSIFSRGKQRNELF